MAVKAAQATNTRRRRRRTQWRILATTLNCAEQSSVKALLGEEQAGSLEKWLPRGADIYAVAVQECGCWAELRRTVEAHLGSAYTLVSYEKIGEKRVRGRIAAAVFARKCDVDDGLVEEVTTKKMLMDVGSTGKGASTKGGVAIEVRVGARVPVFRRGSFARGRRRSRAARCGTPARRLS